jgi:hypothetical protein
MEMIRFHKKHIRSLKHKTVAYTVLKDRDCCHCCDLRCVTQDSHGSYGFGISEARGKCSVKECRFIVLFR